MAPDAAQSIAQILESSSDEFGKIIADGTTNELDIAVFAVKSTGTGTITIQVQVEQEW